MADKRFKVKHGLVVDNGGAEFTGSLNVAGSITATSFTGSFEGTASYTPTLQEVTDNGNTTTNSVTASSILVDGNTTNTLTVRGNESILLLDTENTNGDTLVTFENSGDGTHTWDIGRSNNGTFRIRKGGTSYISIDPNSNLMSIQQGDLEITGSLIITGSGIYFIEPSGIYEGGNLRWTFNNYDFHGINNGAARIVGSFSAGTPSHTFQGDTDTGVGWVSADVFGAYAGATRVATFDNSGVQVTGSLIVTGGVSGSYVSASNLVIDRLSFIDDGNTYIESLTDNEISFRSNGTEMMYITSSAIYSRNFYPLTDDTFRLGTFSQEWDELWVDSVRTGGGGLTLVTTVGDIRLNTRLKTAMTIKDDTGYVIIGNVTSSRADVHFEVSGSTILGINPTDTHQVTGSLTVTGSISIPDNAYYYAGDNNDFQIIHNGSSTFLDNVTGNFYLRSRASNADMYLEVAPGGASTRAITIDGPTLDIDFPNSNLSVSGSITAGHDGASHIMSGSFNVSGSVILPVVSQDNSATEILARNGSNQVVWRASTSLGGGGGDGLWQTGSDGLQIYYNDNVMIGGANNVTESRALFDVSGSIHAGIAGDNTHIFTGSMTVTADMAIGTTVDSTTKLTIEGGNNEKIMHLSSTDGSPNQYMVFIDRNNNQTTPTGSWAALRISDHSTNYAFYVETQTLDPLFSIRGTQKIVNYIDTDISGSLVVTGSVNVKGNTTLTGSLVFDNLAGGASPSLVANNASNQRITLNGQMDSSFSSFTWLLPNTGSSATSPTLIPNKASTNTGIGGATGQLSFIVGGNQAWNIDTNGHLSGSAGKDLYVSGSILMTSTTGNTYTLAEPYDTNEIALKVSRWERWNGSESIIFNASGITFSSTGMSLLLGNNPVTSTNSGTKLTGSFSGSFTGDGSNLTGITTGTGFDDRVAYWNGTDTWASSGDFYFNDVSLLLTVPNLSVTANAKIGNDITDAHTLTGSLDVSGSISGSFSGSFQGDGSGLTNLTSANLDNNTINIGDESFTLGASADTTLSGMTGITMTTTQARIKYGVYTAGDNNYGMGFVNGFTYGALGDGGDGYAVTFQTNTSTSRGFWWGKNGHSTAQGAMAVTNDGKLTVAHSIRAGYGESDTTSPGATYRLDISGDAQIDGDLTVTGKVTAQEFHTEFVSSSIVYSSGSTKFGDTQDDTHSFTGSVEITGSEVVSNDITLDGILYLSSSTIPKIQATSDDVVRITNNSGYLQFNGAYLLGGGGLSSAYINFLGNSGTAYAFRNDTDSGYGKVGTADDGVLGITSQGTRIVTVDSNGMQITGSLTVTNGAYVSQSNLYLDTTRRIYFDGQSGNDYIYAPADNALAIALNGTNEYGIQTTQFFPYQDDANSIGAPTARWADAYFVDINTGTTDGNFTRLRGYNTASLTWAEFVTITAGDSPTLNITDAEGTVTVSGSFSGSFRGDGSGLTGITTSDTLQDVTDNGATTTNAITVSNTASVDLLSVNGGSPSTATNEADIVGTLRVWDGGGDASKILIGSLTAPNSERLLISPTHIRLNDNNGTLTIDGDNLGHGGELILYGRNNTSNAGGFLIRGSISNNNLLWGSGSGDVGIRTTTRTNDVTILGGVDITGSLTASGSIHYLIGNVGFNTTDVEAWGGAVELNAIEGLKSSVVFSTNTDSGDFIGIVSNAYWSASDWYYKTTDESINIAGYNGEFHVRIASSGTANTSITYTEALIIDNSGNATFIDQITGSDLRITNDAHVVNHMGVGITPQPNDALFVQDSDTSTHVKTSLSIGSYPATVHIRNLDQTAAQTPGYLLISSYPGNSTLATVYVGGFSTSGNNSALVMGVEEGGQLNEKLRISNTTDASYTFSLTGSLQLTGSSLEVVDGNISGSFIGDGSGLTGISAGDSDWSDSGSYVATPKDVQVTGSFEVTGSALRATVGSANIVGTANNLLNVGYSTDGPSVASGQITVKAGSTGSDASINITGISTTTRDDYYMEIYHSGLGDPYQRFMVGQNPLYEAYTLGIDNSVDTNPFKITVAKANSQLSPSQTSSVFEIHPYYDAASPYNYLSGSIRMGHLSVDEVQITGSVKVTGSLVITNASNGNAIDLNPNLDTTSPRIYLYNGSTYIGGGQYSFIIGLENNNRFTMNTSNVSLNYAGKTWSSLFFNTNMGTNNKSTAGTGVFWQWGGTVNQSAAADGYTALKLNMTETSVTGSQNYLLQLQTDSNDKFVVDNVGNVTAAGTITAQEFHTEFVSSSIIYSSGSTKFGDTLDDVHAFTGSVGITGSLTLTTEEGNTDNPIEVRTNDGSYAKLYQAQGSGFGPAFRGFINSGSLTSETNSTFVWGDIDTGLDIGTYPVMIFKTSRASTNDIATRPLYSFRNNVTDIINIQPTSQVQISGSLNVSGSAPITIFNSGSDTDITFGGSENVRLILDADTSNFDESWNPKLIFYQDGRTTEGRVELDDSNNLVVRAVTDGDDVLIYTQNATEKISVMDAEQIIRLEAANSVQVTGSFISNNSSGSFSGSFQGDGSGLTGVGGGNLIQPITIPYPDNEEKVPVFFTPDAITISEMRATLIPSASSSPSVTWAARHDTDLSATGTLITGSVLTNTGSGESITSFSDATVPANSHVWIETSAASGVAKHMTVSIIYTID